MTNNVFEQLTEALEVDRDFDEVRDRAYDLLEASNLEVIRLGGIAVVNGFSRDIVVEQTWGTVERQRNMMRAIGYANIVRPEMKSREDEFNIVSRRVAIAGDIALVLRQKSWSRDGHGFWEIVDTEGLEYALDEYSCPRTTVITAYDLRNNEAFITTMLSPDWFKGHSHEFTEEWGRAFYPFGSHEFESAIARRKEKPVWKTAADMSDEALTVAAGYNARFNALLDEVEANI